MAEKINRVILTPENAVYPELSLLADESRLSEYKERIAKYGEKARKTLDVFSFADGVVKGSNSFANVEIASADIALPSQLEHAVRLNPGFFRGCYEYIGLALRTNGDSYDANDYVAKNLFRQVQKRTGKKPTPECPARISLKGLRVKENDNSAYGLVFLISDKTEIIYVPQFASGNNEKKFLTTTKKGIPIFDKAGNRTFYARDKGLSRLFLYRGLDLDSFGGGLASSDDGGRVVLVSTPKASCEVSGGKRK